MSQRKTSYRKTTILKSVKNNLMSDLESEKEENQRKLKDYFMKFFTYSMAYLIDHINEKSKREKQDKVNATFGQITPFQKKFPIIFDYHLNSDSKKYG